MRNTAAVLLLIVQIVGSVPDCAVQLCTPKEWCRYCIKVRNGPGYYEDPTSCSHFYLCSGTKDYADALRARCPPCQYWNQNLLTCVPLRSANCPKGTTPANREPYPDPRYCSHYYQCTNDGYTTECCKRPNNYFNPNTLACEPNPACNDYCDKVVTTTIPSTTRKPSGPTCRHSSGWYYERDPVNLSTYYLLVGGNRHSTFSCAPDIFNLVTCSCPVKTTSTVTTRKTTTPTVTTRKTTTPSTTTYKTTTPSSTTTRTPSGPTCRHYSGWYYERDPVNPSTYYLLVGGNRHITYSCAPYIFNLVTCSCPVKTTPTVTTRKTTTPTVTTRKTTTPSTTTYKTTTPSSTTTRTPSGPTCRHSSGWYYERDPVNPSTYYLLVGGNRHITYSCAPDIFNLVTCSCPVKTTPTVTTRKTTTPTVTTRKTTTPSTTTYKTTTPSSTTTRTPSGPTCRHSSGWYYERDPVNPSTYYLLVGGNRHITYSCAPDIFNLVTCSCPVKTTPTVTTRKTTTPTVTTRKTTTPSTTTYKTTTPSSTTTRTPSGPTCRHSSGWYYERDPVNLSTYYLLVGGNRHITYSCAPDIFNLVTCSCPVKTTPTVTTRKTTTPTVTTLKTTTPTLTTRKTTTPSTTTTRQPLGPTCKRYGLTYEQDPNNPSVYYLLAPNGKRIASYSCAPDTFDLTTCTCASKTTPAVTTPKTTTTTARPDHRCLLLHAKLMSDFRDEKNNYINPGTVYIDSAVHAAKFEAKITDTLEIPRFNNYDFSSGFTISVWFKLDPSRANLFSGIVSNGDCTGDGTVNIWYDNKSVNAAVCGMNTKVSIPIEAGKWYQVVLTYDGETMTLYVNGAGKSLMCKAVPPDLRKHAPFSFGYNFCGKGGFSGYMFDIHIYSCSLTPAEVGKLYNYGKKLVP